MKLQTEAFSISSAFVRTSSFENTSSKKIKKFSDCFNPRIWNLFDLKFHRKSHEKKFWNFFSAAAKLKNNWFRSRSREKKSSKRESPLAGKFVRKLPWNPLTKFYFSSKTLWYDGALWLQQQQCEIYNWLTNIILLC